MPVAATDILFMKSAIGTSDGGAESATLILDGVDNDLWADINDAARAAGGTRYKKFFIRNDNGTETMSKPTVWIAQSPPGITVSIGYGAFTTDDDDTAGGNMTAWTANAKVSLTSSSSDLRNATITGLDTTGEPVSEVVALTGITEVLSANTYSKVWGIRLSALNGSNTVTVKQGTGGTTRGTIAPNVLCCWLWVVATTKATGIKVPSVLPSTSIPVWCRQVWSAGIAAVRPTAQLVAVEENA